MKIDLNNAARMDHPERARYLARALGYQKQMVAACRRFAARGCHVEASSILRRLLRERRAFKLAASWQSI